MFAARQSGFSSVGRPIFLIELLQSDNSCAVTEPRDPTLDVLLLRERGVIP